VQDGVFEQAVISELAAAGGQVVKAHGAHYLLRGLINLAEAFELFVAASKHYVDVSLVAALVAKASASPVAVYSSP